MLTCDNETSLGFGLRQKIGRWSLIYIDNKSCYFLIFKSHWDLITVTHTCFNSEPIPSKCSSVMFSNFHENSFWLYSSLFWSPKWPFTVEFPLKIHFRCSIRSSYVTDLCSSLTKVYIYYYNRLKLRQFTDKSLDIQSTTVADKTCNFIHLVRHYSSVPNTII